MEKQTSSVGIAMVLLASLGAALATSGCDDAESEAKAAALELRDVSAYWAVRGKDQEQNHYIHPVVRFRVWNKGNAEAGYIQAMAVFKRESFPDEPWGNDFLYSISESPLSPDSGSELLTMRSDTNFISKDSPERMFENEKWEEISVAVFLRVGPSAWKPALTLVVPKRIGAPGLEKFLGPEESTNSPSAGS
ncbi:MAG: hypothetical protein ACRD21_19025 [Vicinamibacteria bacterium]